MIIISQDMRAVINYDHVSVVCISGDGQGIIAKGAGGSEGSRMGKYRNADTCRNVLAMFASAYDADLPSFKFPEEREIEYARQHTSKYNSQNNRHGGS